MRTEDGYVITKCLNGEPEAFGFLMDKYKGSVYAFAYSKLRNFHDAEDVTQEVFIKAYQKLRSLRRWDNFLAWLYAITSNMCKNWIRFKANRPDSEFVEDQSAEVLMQPSLSSYREDRIDETLREALDSLPETQRQVLTLHYLGGMNSKEIARFLGISPGAVWERLSRSRAQLREEMLEIMSTTFEAQKLQAGFTMRMVEIVKRIRIHPMPRMAGLPWGMSLAAGIIITILSVGTHINLTNTEPYVSISSLPGKSMAQDVGEFPVDMMKVSDISFTSGQQISRNGSDEVFADMQNAMFMAPQAGEGTWKKKADMPTARSWLSTCVVNGRIYAIGGTAGAHDGETFSTVEEYDPAADTWIGKVGMRMPRGGLSTGVVGEKIYAIGGGLIDTAFSEVEEYDPATDTWSKKADMPTARAFFDASVMNERIYVFGGCVGWSNAFSTVEEYDPAANKWTKKADMPTARAGLSTSAVNGKIYAIGGIAAPFVLDQRTVLSTVEEYDPETDTWTRKANMPTARGLLTSSVVDGKILAIGGENKAGKALSIVEEYDPATDTWTKRADMLTARGGASSCVVNGKIYAIGGSIFFEAPGLPTVEEYDPKGYEIAPQGTLPTTWGEAKRAAAKLH